MAVHAFRPRYTNLVSMFRDSVARHASRPLFGVRDGAGWRWATYAEVGRDVDRMRAALASLGVGRGDRVAVISNNRIEWAVCCYATYGLGAAYVPMYEAQLDREWRYILADCGAKVCFVPDEAIYNRVAALRAELPQLQRVVAFEGGPGDGDTYRGLLERGAQAPVAAVVPDEKEVAGFIYTSGTTGNPKGVLLTQSNLACNISALQEIIPFSPEDRSLSFLPWAHSFGQVVELHGMVSIGGSLGICEGVDKIIPNLAEVRPTVLCAVPRIFNRIYDGVQKNMAAKPAPIRVLFSLAMSARAKERRGEAPTLAESLALPVARRLVFSKIIEKFGGRLKYAVSGAAALSREVAEFIDNLGITVYEGYGLTETSPIATANTPGARRIGSVGKPIPGVVVKLDHEVTNDPENGEIIVYGHNVMRGYHALPEETARVFTPDGGFRTGDMGRFDNDGFLYITGRIKEQYKLENGKYVAPAALEEKLTLSPYIAQIMVHGANKPYNVAVVVPDLAALGAWAQTQGLDTSSPDKYLHHAQTHALLQAELDKYGADFKSFDRVRKFIVTAEEFSAANDMLTQTLKLKRRNVLARYEPQLEALYAEGTRASA